MIDESLARHVKAEHRAGLGTFRPPTREELVEFCREKKLGLDVDHFLDFYQSKGWKVGKVPMKDWRAAARRAAREGWCPGPQQKARSHETCHKCETCNKYRRESDMRQDRARPSIWYCREHPVEREPEYRQVASRSDIERMLTKPKPAEARRQPQDNEDLWQMPVEGDSL